MRFGSERPGMWRDGLMRCRRKERSTVCSPTRVRCKCASQSVEDVAAPVIGRWLSLPTC
jgi:hypothetical protein